MSDEPTVFNTKSAETLEPERVLSLDTYVMGFRSEKKNLNKTTDEAFLFFHGFPANRGVKNRDIAELAFQELKRDSYFAHYKGLGNSPGFFEFNHSIQDSIKAARDILKLGPYRRLHIFGHSWGTVVAGNVALALGEKASTLILACPLTRISTDNQVLVSLVEETAKEMPGVFGPQSLEQIKDEMHHIASYAQLWDLAPKFDHEKTLITIIQALRDAATPAVKTRELLSRFKSRPNYVELDLDHAFMDDRPEFVRTVVREFRKMLALIRK